MNYTKLIQIAVKRAQKRSSLEGFAEGQLIAIPTEPRAGRFLKFEEKLVIVETYRGIEKWNLEEVFNPYTAKEEMDKILEDMHLNN